MEFTGLLQQQINDQILLLSMDEQRTNLLIINGFEFSIYVAKLPGYTNEQFIRFCEDNLQIFYTSLEIVYLKEADTSLIGQQYPYLKITSPDQYGIQNLYKMQQDDNDQPQQIEVYKDNYLQELVNEQLIPSKYQLKSEFYLKYYQQLQNSTPNDELEYLIKPYLQFPFRHCQNKLEQIQLKYNLNLCDTIIIPNDSYYIDNPSKYNVDRVYFVNINDIKQSPESKIQQSLKYYNYLMFDIENVVISVAKTKTEKTKKMLDKVEKNWNNLSNIVQNQITFLSSPVNDTTDARYDQTEIICISFIVCGFDGTIKDKIAVVRSQVTENEINSMDDQQVVDKIIICDSEHDLLKETINILSDKRYNIIMHFNGWAYDERVLMTRFMLHNLLEEYNQRMKTVMFDDKYINQPIQINRQYKISASRNLLNICQITNPLRFSLDVYALNLHESVDAQKHDDNTLNGLLHYYGLGTKGDVSYQQITDWFLDNDVNNLKKVYWYCQVDSIQTARLQNKLLLLLQQIQMSQLTQVSLNKCIFNAVGMKVQTCVQKYYLKHNFAYTDVKNPFKSLYDHGTGFELRNVGGEVVCAQPGFNKYITAIDAESMYPAQKEANNIDKGFMLLPDQMIYIKQYIKDLKVTRVYDLYSPYLSQTVFVQGVQLFEENFQINQQDAFYMNMIHTKHSQFDTYKKSHRLRIQFQYRGQIYIYEMFFFERSNMQLKYPFVFYLQNIGTDKSHQYSKQQLHPSPKSDLLSSLRVNRQAVKSVMKEIKTQMKQENLTQDELIELENNLNFNDMKQYSIKIIMNSEYGSTDTDIYPMYDHFGASCVTCCSRYIIQFARDMLQSREIYLPLSNDDMKFDVQFNKNTIDRYNTFIRCGVLTQHIPDVEISIYDDYIKIPDIKLIYQDTDSNYITMTALNHIKTIDDQHERYIKTMIHGLFNDVFCELVRCIMNKYPLKFSFEGAFYRSWYLKKKNYLGQSVSPLPLDYDQFVNNKKIQIIKGGDIQEQINFEDMDYDDDIYEYLRNKHIKTTGVKLTRRDATDLQKFWLMRFIQSLLNQDGDTDYTQFVYTKSRELTQQLLDEMSEMQMKMFTQKTKLNQKQLNYDPENDEPTTLKYLIYSYNQNNEQQLGLGDVIYTYIAQPSNQPYFYFDQTFKVTQQTKFLTKDQLQQTWKQLGIKQPYYNYYAFGQCVNMLMFIPLKQLGEDTKQTFYTNQAKEVLNGIIQTRIQSITCSVENYSTILNIIHQRIKQNQQNIGLKMFIKNSNSGEYFQVMFKTAYSQISRLQNTGKIRLSENDKIKLNELGEFI